MAEPEKPFICYKKGWSMQIVPRNKAGWIALTLWIVSLVPPAVGFTWLMAGEPTEGKAIAYTIGFTLMMLAWGGGMIIWTKNRSEVVDLDELLKLKRELEAKKRRGSR
jgi:hypothetical protein